MIGNSNDFHRCVVLLDFFEKVFGEGLADVPQAEQGNADFFAHGYLRWLGW